MRRGRDIRWAFRGGHGGATGVTVGLVISNVQISVTASSATISWDCSLPATGQVEYGTTISYGSWSTFEPAYLSHHSQTILGLDGATTYFFQIHSTDVDGRGANHAGSFTTSGSVSPGVGPRYAEGTGPGAPTGGYVHTMSGITDITGATDVRDEVMGYITQTMTNHPGSEDQHHVIVIPSGWILRFNGPGIHLVGAQYYDFYMYGATILNKGSGTPSGGGPDNAAFVLIDCHDMIFEGGSFEGDNTSNYRTEPQYAAGNEHACGFHIRDGCTDLEIADIYIRHQWGHSLYIAGSEDGAHQSRINYHHCYVDGMGVMGMNVVAGTDITLAWHDIRHTGLGPIDIEDGEPGIDYIQNLTIADNSIEVFSWDDYYDNGAIGTYGSSSGRAITKTGVYILRNEVKTGPVITSGESYPMSNGRGQPVGIVSSLEHGGGRATDIVVRDNTFTDVYPGFGDYWEDRGGAYIHVSNADNVTITGNTCTGSSGAVSETPGCTNVVDTPNP